MNAFVPFLSQLELLADDDESFVLGAAVTHPYPLVTGNDSTHTSIRALAEGEAKVARIGHQLSAVGHLK